MQTGGNQFGKFEVIEGGRVKSSAVPSRADITMAYGQWTRADKPLGLGYLAFKYGVSQNELAHRFREMDLAKARQEGFTAGRNSLWRRAA